MSDNDIAEAEFYAEFASELVDEWGMALVTEVVQAKTLSPDEAMRQLGEAATNLAVAMEEVFKSIAETLFPATEQVVKSMCEFYEKLQREKLMYQLSWLPSPVAEWIAYHWPEKWLPKI